MDDRTEVEQSIDGAVDKGKENEGKMQEKQKIGKQLFEKGAYNKTKIGWDRYI